MVKVKEDLTGRKFGRLTVLEQTDDYVGPSGRHKDQWICSCSCGNPKKVITLGASLKSGHTTSCGCLVREKALKNFELNPGNKIDRTGQRYGRLVALYEVEQDDTDDIIWMCQCDCGNMVKVKSSYLGSGNTKSCGCLRNERISLLNKKENRKDLSGEFGIIWSTNTNEEIYFDLEDAEEILKHTWSIGKRGYPTTIINKKTVPMHRFLGYYHPDHHDRNKLNNRRENLVPCTQQENIRNSSIRSNNTSGVTGVSWNKKKEKWYAYITVDDKMKNLGRYENKDSAIKARLQAEKKYFGEFAPQKHLYKQYGI